ncbi:RNA recognition motif domain-containing protein [Calothrix sp. 336/3]|uniref:RNA recognition motif domain-containing protein n=1 Tax=Calothrix sp. 336/3 TaxID=1337936 RepID=UPI0004E2BD2C|nr:RNA-binding protein [Calothrix sp. 336/3]AKG21742.1 RNA-binding protein [Calothrix sp. 336/3]
MSVYVANLSCEVTEDDLKQLFQEYGTVRKVEMPSDQKTGSHRGFAVIEMDTDAEEISAIQMLRGSEWMGQILTLNRARTEVGEVSSYHS